MKGKVINFNQEKSFGFILGENGQNYFFHTSDVNLPFEVSKHKMLTFTPSTNKKGLCAKNIVLGKSCQTTQNKYQSKTNFVSYGGVGVDLNSIQSMGPVYKDHYENDGKFWYTQEFILITSKNGKTTKVECNNATEVIAELYAQGKANNRQC